MRLIGKVTNTESASEFVDKRRRITITVEGANSGFRKLQVPDEEFQLDDEVTLFVVPGRVEEIPTTYDQAMAIIDESVRRQQEGNVDDGNLLRQPESPLTPYGLHVVKGGGDAS